MIQRADVVPVLVNSFMANYKTAMKHYEKKEQLEFTNYLLHVLMTYIIREEKRRANSIQKGLETLQKRYGKKFQAYEEARLHIYFQFDRVLLEKGIYTSKELIDPKEQRLKAVERTAFLKQVRTHLNQCFDDLKFELKILHSLEQPQSIAIDEKSKTRTITRRPADTLTVLNKQQTALLIHYLQKKEVFLQEELLHHTRAGEAFEILTGYNGHTLSMYLGATHTEHNKNIKNLKQLSELFSLLKKEVDRDLNRI